MQDIDLAFGYIVKYRRPLVGIKTQKELADCLNYSVSLIRKIEADEYASLNMEHVEKLTKCLEIPSDQIDKFKSLALSPEDLTEEDLSSLKTLTIFPGTSGSSSTRKVPWPPSWPEPNFHEDKKSKLSRLMESIQRGKIINVFGSVPGIGRRTLINEALRRLDSQGKLRNIFPDGLIFYTFDVTSPYPEAVFNHILTSLGEVKISTPYNDVRRILAEKNLLLVLEDIEKAKDLEKLIEVKGSCTLLLKGDLFIVTKLDEQIEVELLQMDTAVRLLRAVSGIELERTLAQEICQQLENIPVAIEAAGIYLQRIGKSPPKNFLEALLSSPPGEKIERPFRENYKLLSKLAQEVLTIIGLLAFGSFNIEVIKAGLNNHDEEEIEAALNELLMLKWLRYESRYRVSHRVHYSVIQKISPAEPELEKRIGTYFIHFALTQAKEGLFGYRRLDVERSHILAILDKLVKGEMWSLTLQLIEAIDPYLDRQHHWKAREIVLEYGLKAVQQKQENDRFGEAKFLNDLGNLYSKQEEWDRAAEKYALALTISREIGDKMMEGNTLNNLGTHSHRQGHLVEAEEYYKIALKAIQFEEEQQEGGQKLEGTILGNLGNIYTEKPTKWAEAVEFYKRAINISREVDDIFYKGLWLGNLARLYHQLNETNEAIEHYAQAIDAMHKAGDVLGKLWLLIDCGKFYHHKVRDQQKARESFVQAEAICNQYTLRLPSDLEKGLNLIGGL